MVGSNLFEKKDEEDPPSDLSSEISVWWTIFQQVSHTLGCVGAK